MIRRAAAAWTAAALALALGAAGSIACGRRDAPTGADRTRADEEERAEEAVVERRRVTLWLPGAAGRLAPVEAEIESAPEPRARIAALVAALLAAEPEGDAVALFPVAVELSAVLPTADGTLYLDLRRADGGEPPGAGSTLETQRIYAIVHTLTRNEPSVERVVLLWNGEQRLSFSGHLDTSRPLHPRPELEPR